MLLLRKIFRIISNTIYVAAFALILWSMFFGPTLFENVEIIRTIREFLPAPYNSGMYWKGLGGLLTASPLIVAGAVARALGGGEYGHIDDQMRKHKKDSQQP